MEDDVAVGKGEGEAEAEVMTGESGKKSLQPCKPNS